LFLGRWGVEETARRMVDACESVKTLNLGIEKGALFNAVAPYIMAEAAKRSVSMRPEPLSHENETKNDRITWALQGRFEHGKILLRKDAPWLKEFEDEYVNFPSRMVHDDSMDALAFVVQLAKGAVFHNFAHMAEESYWEPVDASLGF